MNEGASESCCLARKRIIRDWRYTKEWKTHLVLDILKQCDEATDVIIKGKQPVVDSMPVVFMLHLQKPLENYGLNHQ
jgi:hypothetical protein